MEFDHHLPDAMVLQQMGSRLSAIRLQRDWTQAQLAEESGVSKRTIERLESGGSVQLASFIRVLRALQMLPSLERLLPQTQPSPMQQLEMQGKARQRASSARAAPTYHVEESEKAVWRWGDDGGSESS